MTTTKYDTKFPIFETEPCVYCDEMFRPEDGWTNAYGSFCCDECSYIDRKLK